MTFREAGSVLPTNVLSGVAILNEALYFCGYIVSLERDIRPRSRTLATVAVHDGLVAQTGNHECREASMKISARNQISGTIVSITPGAVNGSIKVEIGGGNVVTANITEEAIADLGLAEGEAVTVIIKASDVMIGK